MKKTKLRFTLSAMALLSMFSMLSSCGVQDEASIIQGESTADDAPEQSPPPADEPIPGPRPGVYDPSAPQPQPGQPDHYDVRADLAGKYIIRGNSPLRRSSGAPLSTPYTHRGLPSPYVSSSGKFQYKPGTSPLVFPPLIPPNVLGPGFSAPVIRLTPQLVGK